MQLRKAPSQHDILSNLIDYYVHGKDYIELKERLIDRIYQRDYEVIRGQLHDAYDGLIGAGYDQLKVLSFIEKCFYTYKPRTFKLFFYYDELKVRPYEALDCLADDFLDWEDHFISIRTG